MDQALVGYRPPSPGEEFSGPIPLNLLDGMYAPYVALHTQPLPWLRVLGDVRLDVVSFDLQRVCRTTCSKEPNGRNNDVIPSFKGNVILGPWFGTEWFLNVGTGFYNPDDREPAGSTLEKKLSRTTAYEGGVRTQPWDGIELMASLWSAELQTDFRFLEGGETIEDGTFAPYLTLHTQPFSWLQVRGDVRLDVVSFDLQKVCRATCTKELNNANNDVIPSLKGNLIFGPW